MSEILSHIKLFKWHLCFAGCCGEDRLHPSAPVSGSIRLETNVCAAHSHSQNEKVPNSYWTLNQDHYVQWYSVGANYSINVTWKRSLLLVFILSLNSSYRPLICYFCLSDGSLATKQILFLQRPTLPRKRRDLTVCVHGVTFISATKEKILLKLD